MTRITENLENEIAKKAVIGAIDIIDIYLTEDLGYELYSEKWEDARNRIHVKLSARLKKREF